ncbi:MAG TPA: MarR family transcriptional regulator, partial [Acidimicrobiales bacterium]|nr:MarR family transcriptional regulator [Acidimicrobiales bacterium]
MTGRTIETADELPARLRIAVTRLNRRLRQESTTGVSPSQESALSTINRLGTPTLGELAQAEQVQPPTMTRVVAAMEAAALVAAAGDVGRRLHRRHHPGHRRRLDLLCLRELPESRRPEAVDRREGG